MTGIRQLSSDMVSKDGYFMPKGALAFISQVAVSHNPQVYPDPYTFDPSRWTAAADAAALETSQFPFALGARNCIGQSLAQAELRTILPRLIRDHDFSIEQEGHIASYGTMRLENCLLRVTRL